MFFILFLFFRAQFERMYSSKVVFSIFLHVFLLLLHSSCVISYSSLARLFLYLLVYIQGLIMYVWDVGLGLATTSHTSNFVVYVFSYKTHGRLFL